MSSRITFLADASTFMEFDSNEVRDLASQYTNVNLYRNLIFLKLVEKHGLLGSLQKLDKLYDELNKNPISFEIDAFLTKEAIVLLQEQLRNYYEVTVLEKISNLFDTGEIPTVDWALDEKVVPGLVSPLNQSSQIWFWEIDAVSGIEALDRTQDNDACAVRSEHKKVAYNTIFYGENEESLLKKSKNVRQIISSFCDSPENANHADKLRYFGNTSIAVLDSLPGEFSWYSRQNRKPKRQIKAIPPGILE